MAFTVQCSTPSVSLIEGRPATTSLAIAEHFGKRHDHVMRDIDRLCAELPEDFRVPNFGETFRDVPGPKGATRRERLANVYFDGFMLLVMGYTGKKALAMKLAYIGAFNAMRAKLERQPDALPDSITPEQQAQLHAIVAAKVGMLPKTVQRKAYAEAWTRFCRHFRIARYAQLPPAKMGEAVDYLVSVEWKAAALPPSSSEIPNTSPAALPVPVDAPKQLDTLHRARERCRFEFLPQAYSSLDREAAERSHLATDLYKLQDCLWAALYNICSAAARLRA